MGDGIDQDLILNSHPAVSQHTKGESASNGQLSAILFDPLAKGLRPSGCVSTLDSDMNTSTNGFNLIKPLHMYLLSSHDNLNASWKTALPLFGRIQKPQKLAFLSSSPDRPDVDGVASPVLSKVPDMSSSSA